VRIKRAAVASIGHLQTTKITGDTPEASRRLNKWLERAYRAVYNLFGHLYDILKTHKNL
jgi:hypothetical protein